MRKIDIYDTKITKMYSVAIIYVKSKNAFLLLKRSNVLTKYPGDICFPGGGFDELLDKSTFDTAIRETEEETAIKLEIYDYLGFIATYITSRNEFVDAHFFIIKDMPHIVLSEESDCIILFPKDVILKQNFKENKDARKHKLKLLYQNNCIWGITAYILYELIDSLYFTTI